MKNIFRPNFGKKILFTLVNSKRIRSLLNHHLNLCSQILIISLIDYIFLKSLHELCGSTDENNIDIGLASSEAGAEPLWLADYGRACRTDSDCAYSCGRYKTGSCAAGFCICPLSD